MNQGRSRAEHILKALETNATYKDWPDAITYCTDKKNISISYEQLIYRAKRWAKALSSSASSGDRVLIFMSAGLDFFAAFYACLYLGAIAVPLPRPQGAGKKDALKAVIKDAMPSAVITNYDVISFDSDLRDNLVIFTVMELDSEYELLTDITLDPDAIMVLQYTSGSTGMPKAVAIDNNNLLSNSYSIGRAFEHSANTQGLVWLPPYHDMGLVGGVIHPLVEGFRTGILCPFKFMQKPSRWLRAISELKVNTSGGPNFAFAECVKRIKNQDIEGVDLSSWDLAFVGAEPIRYEVLHQFSERFSSINFNRDAFFPCYGLAEATLLVSGGPKIAALKIQEGDGKHLLDSGFTINGCSVVIVDPHCLQPVADGEEGEIWVHGNNVSRGYWNNPDASQASFNARLLGDPKTYLRTGDNGYFVDGRLVVTGRIKDLIIIRGVNHHPEDIERSSMDAAPELWGMANAAISVNINNEENLILVQEVTPLSDVSSIKEKIKLIVFQVHGINLHDCIFVKQRSLPKTSSGKVKRYHTQQLYYQSKLLTLNIG
ncbi:fatty acyl-AMP ligase [uncultured Shewanella sp.]|uniref:fatty acyl-AMP ligase n=1 Tax=uncultured Shewanella sp. TaxID=173975 RepID=UPI00261F8DA6|nr:fatty acyl-AMP ligase [uncultured Shewanella sp.]